MVDDSMPVYVSTFWFGIRQGLRVSDKGLLDSDLLLSPTGRRLQVVDIA